MDRFFYNTDLNNFTTEPYAQEFFMEWKEDTYDVLGSEFLKELNTLDQTGEHRVIKHECRFDNLAYELLDSQFMWWILMEYNEYIDWDVKMNSKIKIPNIVSIRELIHKMIVYQNRKNLG